MSPLTIVFAFAAGLFSTLSPCVLPILPAVLGAATSEHRFGPLVLIAGLAMSFTAIGMFAVTIGYGVGFDPEFFRIASAAVLVAAGAVLLVPWLQNQVSILAAPAANWIASRTGGFKSAGLSGQFGLGLLLGAVWTPCTGPTLGAASVLASQGKNLWQATLTMMVFSAGAALPLLALALVSRQTMLSCRGRLLRAGKSGKSVLGAMLAILGLLIASGADKIIEAALTDWSPAWLTELSTRF